MSNGQFEDEDEESFKPTKSLKLAPSAVAPVSKKQVTERFNQRVDAIEKDKKDAQSTLNTLSIELLSMMDDKTLPINKNSLIKDNETRTLKELITFTKRLDNDEMEELNAGVTALSTLLLTLLLRQRNRMNELEFEIETLKRNSKPLPPPKEK